MHVFDSFNLLFSKNNVAIKIKPATPRRAGHHTGRGRAGAAGNSENAAKTNGRNIAVKESPVGIPVDLLFSILRSYLKYFAIFVIEFDNKYV